MAILWVDLSICISGIFAHGHIGLCVKFGQNHGSFDLFPTHSLTWGQNGI